VSVATVSKVINGRYGVANETAARVMVIVDELGYQSSLGARSLRSQRTDVIGLLVAEFEPFGAEILKGVGTALHGTGYELLAYAGASCGADSGWEHRHLSRLSGTLIDGAILITPSAVDIDTGIPLVAIDPHTESDGLPTVRSDNVIGATMATRHLVEIGHRRIAFIAGRSDLHSSTQRQQGYERALAQAGIPVDPALVRNGFRDQGVARTVAFELLSRPDRPTAVFAADDLSALGTVDLARELGLRVPEDLSVIGFDDIPEAAQARPPLTTVRQPLQQMGRVAGELLLGRLAGTVDVSRSVVLSTSLIRRGTTAPPPSR
jgi:LacI family transcriptional regulator